VFAWHCWLSRAMGGIGLGLAAIAMFLAGFGFADPDEVHGDTRLSWAAMGALALGLANGVAAGTMLSCPRRTWVWGLAALVAGVGTGLGMVRWGSVATLHLAVTEGRPAFAWARMSSLPLVLNALLVLYPWLAALVLLGAARGGSRRVAARDRAAQ